MSYVPPEKKVAKPTRTDAVEPRAVNAEGPRIADIASQLSDEDRAVLRQYIDRHHPKLFQ